MISLKGIRVYCFFNLLLNVSCGVKGPPLPPLILTPEQSESVDRPKPLNSPRLLRQKINTMP